MYKKEEGEAFFLRKTASVFFCFFRLKQIESGAFFTFAQIIFVNCVRMLN